MRFQQGIEPKLFLWNMNAAFFMRLDNRLDERDKARIEGNLLAWYRGQRAIFANIHFKVKEKGHEALEKDLASKFDMAKNYFLSANIREASGLALNRIEILLDEIDIVINDLLFEYGFILPKNKKQPWDDKVEASY